MGVSIEHEVATRSETLRTSGFFTLQLLGSDEIEELSDFYISHSHSVTARKFHSTMHQSDETYRWQVDQMLRSAIGPKLHRLLPGHRILVANYVIKDSGEDGDVGLHADWTYVDESEFMSINIWCPLVDTHSENGCLHVCPGSQTLSGPHRGTPYVPYSAKEIEVVKARSMALNLKAGEAIIYNSALLHYSEINRSGAVRPAIALVAIPCGAQSVHCFHSNDGLLIYSVDDRFFLENRLDEQPKGYPATRISSIGPRPDLSTIENWPTGPDTPTSNQNHFDK